MNSSSHNPFLESLRASRVVAIVRGGYTVEQYASIATSLVRGGIAAVELTIEQDDAVAAITELSRNGPPGLELGAGTVRSASDAQAAVRAGARYLVSPGFIADVGQVAAAAGIDYLPGVLTPSEIEAAVAQGWSTVKLFPARPLGPAYLRALKAPLSGVEFVATGGIGIDDAGEFLEAGALAVGLGGSLLGNEVDPAAIEERAAKLLASIAP